MCIAHVPDPLLTIWLSFEAICLAIANGHGLRKHLGGRHHARLPVRASGTVALRRLLRSGIGLEPALGQARISVWLCAMIVHA